MNPSAAIVASLRPRRLRPPVPRGIEYRMTLLKRAEKEGSKFVNPVPTTIGGPGLMFKVLPLYFTNRAQREPASPLGPFQPTPACLPQRPQAVCA